MRRLTTPGATGDSGTLRCWRPIRGPNLVQYESPVQTSSRSKPISRERTPETLALLKILALGERQIASGEVQPAAEVIARLRGRRTTG